MKKRLLSFLLAVVLAVSLVPATAFGATIVDSGYCGGEGDGTNLTWTLDSDGALTIDGTGEMMNFEFNPVPWENYETCIQSIIIKPGITTISANSFSGCDSLDNVVLPDSLTSIGDWAFRECSALKSITIPDEVTIVGDGAFYACICLQKVNIGKNVSVIEGWAFKNCPLTDVIIPDSVISIEGCAFECTGIESLVIGNGVTSIGPCAFTGCGLLEKLIIPDSVTSIGEYAFCGCRGLTDLTIGKGVQSMDGFVFADCDSLKNVTIKNGVSTIGGYAFMCCSSLISVEIPESVSSIGSFAFDQCSNLTEIEVNPGNNNYCSVNGVLFDKTQSLLIQYPCGKSADTYEVPNSVETIGSRAFKDCHELRSISITSTVTSISSYAFMNCSALTSITIPDSVNYIGDSSFSDCTALKWMTIGIGVTRIEGWAFNKCYELTDIFYSGDETQWKSIIIDDVGNEILLSSNNIHFSVSPNGPSTYIATTPFRIGTGGDGKSMPKTAEVSGTIWNDEWFFEPSTTYNHELARTAITLSNAAYVLDDKDKGINGEENMKGLLTQFGFDEDAISWNRIKPTAEDNDTVSFTLAAKKLNGGDGSQPTLILIDIKGTSSDEEWYSNFNVGQTTNEHVGFLDAKILVISRLASFFQSLQEANYQLGADTKFLVTGHSRGAAVANLVAATLSKEISQPDNVYAYTFATPATSKVAKTVGYENIFNILNQEDFVPCLPLEKWGYKRFGVDLLLPSISNFVSKERVSYSSFSNKMEQTFQDLTGSNFHPYWNGVKPVNALCADIFLVAPTVKIGYNLQRTGTLNGKETLMQYFNHLAECLCDNEMSELIKSTINYAFGNITLFFVQEHVLCHRVFDAHCPSAYYSWMQSYTADELFGSSNWIANYSFKEITVACPVDVLVYDENDELVASVVNNEIVVNTLAVDVTDDVKTIHLPDGQEYRVEVVTNDSYEQDDTLTYSVTEYEGQEAVSSVAYEDIPLEADSSFDGTVTTSEEEITACTLSSSEETLEPDTVVLAERKSTMISDAAVELIDGAYQVTAKLSCPDASARVLCASYSPEGKMLDITSQAVAETISLRVKEDETAVTLKLFVVNSYGTPLDMCLPVKL